MFVIIGFKCKLLKERCPLDIAYSWSNKRKMKHNNANRTISGSIIARCMEIINIISYKLDLTIIRYIRITL